MTRTRKTVTTVLLALSLGAFGGRLSASLPKSPDYGEVKNPVGEEYRIGPDRLEYDFGEVKRGTIVRHALPILNTSTLPLEIVNLKWG
jgi:hypothetical protein